MTIHELAREFYDIPKNAPVGDYDESPWMDFTTVTIHASYYHGAWQWFWDGKTIWYKRLWQDNASSN